MDLKRFREAAMFSGSALFFCLFKSNTHSFSAPDTHTHTHTHTHTSAHQYKADKHSSRFKHSNVQRVVTKR